MSESKIEQNVNIWKNDASAQAMLAVARIEEAAAGSDSVRHGRNSA